MLGTPPCPGLACISVLALAGLVATTLNSEVAPALTEITIGLQFQFPAAALRLHSVACKTYVCRVHLPFRPAVLGSEFCGSGLEWKDARWSVISLHHAPRAITPARLLFCASVPLCILDDEV